jgi:hypothetical protein
VPCLATVANTPASYTSFDPIFSSRPSREPRHGSQFSALDRSIPPLPDQPPTDVVFLPTRCLFPVPTSPAISSVIIVVRCPINTVLMVLFYPHIHLIFSPIAIVLLAISRSYSYYPTIFLSYDHIALPCRLRRGCTRWRSSAQTSALGPDLDNICVRRGAGFFDDETDTPCTFSPS